MSAMQDLDALEAQAQAALDAIKQAKAAVNANGSQQAGTAGVLAPPQHPQVKGPFQESKANTEWQRVARAMQALGADATWAEIGAHAGFSEDEFKSWRSNPKVVREKRFANAKGGKARVNEKFMAATIAAYPLTNGTVAAKPVTPATPPPVLDAQPAQAEDERPVGWAPWHEQHGDLSAKAPQPTMTPQQATIATKCAWAMERIARDLVDNGIWVKDSGEHYKRAQTYGERYPRQLIEQVRKDGYDPVAIARQLKLIQ